MKHILCTGGSGYIGSHTVLQLVEHGYKVSIIDNLSNSTFECVKRLRELTKSDIPFYDLDNLDEERLRQLFKANKFDGVIHYAALKSVGESVAKPLQYYINNVSGLLVLLKVMASEDANKVFVFSSSATVYKPKETLICEEDPLGPSNPYGNTKLMEEIILDDLFKSDGNWKISILRYFNPAGAHESGRIGEFTDHPANVLPYIQQVAVGRRPHLNVFGDDWGTPDGTGVRDYIHVEDLAEGHIAALDMLFKREQGCCAIHNLGTGRGTSVLELIKMFEKASGRPIPFKITERRPGDLASVVADASKAKKDLGWEPKRSLEKACEAAWKWQSSNPNGYCT